MLSNTPNLIDGVWEVFMMKLPFEAVYIPKKLGQFDVPRTNGGIAGLIGALPLMAKAQVVSTLCYHCIEVLLGIHLIMFLAK